MTTSDQTAVEFKPWGKIARLNREIVITEKLDGTNSAVIVTEDGRVAAQSRNRLITPVDDNYGFAKWVESNADRLRTELGEGYHFGEWWGQGIQRKYGLTEKRFSLFNVKRWDGIENHTQISNLWSVPTIYSGPYSGDVIQQSLDLLRENGSHAAPGFMDPEGIVVYHVAANQMFKVTLKGDDAPKSMAA